MGQKHVYSRIFLRHLQQPRRPSRPQTPAQQKEIAKLEKNGKETGFTIIPLRLFINDRGLAKLVIGIAHGKKEYDKRQSIKEREDKVTMARMMQK